MGYHRPVSYWNPGKQAEHRERRSFRLPDRNRQHILNGAEVNE